MLPDAVNYYHGLLEDEELAHRSIAALNDELERAKLIFGGRRLSPYLRPHFITSSDWKRVVLTGEIIFGALQKVKDEAVQNDEVLEELGLTELERNLVKIDPGYGHVSPTSRLDSFLADDAYSYVELNGESPAGIAFADSATEIFRGLPVMQKFAERYELLGFDGRPKLLDVLLSCYEEFIGGKPEQKPVIAIVDLANLPTQKEFELFRDYFEAQGYDAIIATPEELEFDGKRLSTKGIAIDIVYKRLLVNEYVPIINDHPALLNAYAAGAICMVNSFRSKLVHKKAVFAVLTNERYEYLFNQDELAAIKAHVPWTRRFREEKTFNSGIEIDLVEWTRTNADKLVLKPNDDYGGHGIYIGWNSTQNEWDDAISNALANGDYLVQERVKTAKAIFPMVPDQWDGKILMVEQLVDLDPLLFNGKVGAAFTRLALSDLANVTAGGGMVPTFVIREKDQY
jgi:hypothetical protein